MRISVEAIKRIVKPFLGSDPVFVAGCCNRIFVGHVAPAKCSTCTKDPVAHPVTKLEEVDHVVKTIEDSWA